MRKQTKKEINPYVKAKDGHKLINTINHSTPVEIWEAFEKFWDKTSTEVIVGPEQLTTCATIIDIGHGGWSAWMREVKETPFSYEQLHAIKDLYTDLNRAIKKYGDRKYLDGLKDGRNCLFQLNNGTLSMDDFNNNLGGENRRNV